MLAAKSWSASILTNGWLSPQYGTIVAGYTIDEVVEKLESKGLRRNDAAIKFMATTRRRMIL